MLSESQHSVMCAIAMIMKVERTDWVCLAESKMSMKVTFEL